MEELYVSLSGVDRSALEQIEYSMTFASTLISKFEVDPDMERIVVHFERAEDSGTVEKAVEGIVDRFKEGDFGFQAKVYFEQHLPIQATKAWSEMLRRGIVTPIGDGHVVMRGIAADLMQTIDRKIDSVFAKEFSAEREFYPATIKCETLDQCAHFTSFPEHIDFVGHLRSDLHVLGEFSEECRKSGWSSNLHHGRMDEIEYAVSPSCCYHCYEGMEGWVLEPPGRCVTATLACHRYEGTNQESLSRLRAFTMREIVWVGLPKYVLESRARADELVISWAKEWGFDCIFESANDMFFTNDYQVKASFQRQQEAKKELRLLVPDEERRISVCSSNFHVVSFGKAFNTRVGNRPATSGCLAWGFERCVYAILSQFGFEIEDWPEGLRRDHLRFSR